MSINRSYPFWKNIKKLKKNKTRVESSSYLIFLDFLLENKKEKFIISFLNHPLFSFSKEKENKRICLRIITHYISLLKRRWLKTFLIPCMYSFFYEAKHAFTSVTFLVHSSLFVSHHRDHGLSASSPRHNSFRTRVHKSRSSCSWLKMIGS